MSHRQGLAEILRALAAGDPVTDPQDLEQAFDATGQLTDPMQVRCRLPTAVLQWALAAHGIHGIVRARADDGWAVADLTPSEVDDGSDLRRIAAASSTLRSRGVFVGGPLAPTSSEGWAVAETLAPDGTTDVLFWNFQSHDAAVDEVGNLQDDLVMQWVGDAEAIVETLRSAGIDVKRPSSERKAIVVRPPGAAEADARSADAHHTLARTLLGLGWIEEDGLERWFRSPGAHPSVRVAKASGTNLVLRLGEREDIRAVVDYGSRLDVVLATLDEERDHLGRGPDVAGYLAPISRIATSVRWRPSGADDWKEVS